jgi:hypothetical protein
VDSTFKLPEFVATLWNQKQALAALASSNMQVDEGASQHLDLSITRRLFDRVIAGKGGHVGADLADELNLSNFDRLYKDFVLPECEAVAKLVLNGEGRVLAEKHIDSFLQVVR